MNVAGRTAAHVAEPRSIDELATTVAALYAAGKPFAFVGGGTELELGNAPRALDTVVKTTGCAAVVDYAPEDQTVTVEAGITVAALGAVLAANRQFLALDVPDPARTTVGGAIATNAFGRRRLRFGSIKDNIVGIGIVRPDGTHAHGGGKVVKNVAGFDLPKLMVGALGTLGAVVSATLRVHPLDRARGAVVARGLDVAEVMMLCDGIVAEALVPTSVVAYDADERFDVVVTFDGFPGGVDEQVASVLALALRVSRSAQPLADAELDAYEARERAVRGAARWRVALGAAPTALATFFAAGHAHATQRVYYPLLGAAFVAADALTAAAIPRWRGALERGTVVVAAMPLDARPAVDAWGPPGAAHAVMRRLKDNFDPKGLCNPGRFIGGL